MLALRLPDDIEIRLEELAKRTGRTKSYYAREAIVEHLEELEEIYLAEKELEDIKKGAKTWTLKEMEEELELDSPDWGGMAWETGGRFISEK